MMKLVEIYEGTWVRPDKVLRVNACAPTGEMFPRVCIYFIEGKSHINIKRSFVEDAVKLADKIAGQINDALIIDALSQ